MKDQRSGIETKRSSRELSASATTGSVIKVKANAPRFPYVKPIIKIHVASIGEAPFVCDAQSPLFMLGVTSGYHSLEHGYSITRSQGRVFRWANEWNLKLEHLLQTTSDFAIEKGIEKAKSNLEALVNLYSDDVPVPRYDMREAKMIAKAREKVIQSTKWVTAADITELAGYQSSNKSAGAAKWKASNKIFSVRYRSEDLYPIYSLDKNNEYRPVAGLKPILELFKGIKDSWGVAYWFAGANGFLGGKRPQELLQENPVLVLEAAKDELKGVTHG